MASLLGLGVGNAQAKVDHHRDQQQQRQHRRPDAVVEPGLAALANRFRAPVVCPQRVEQGEHGHGGEEEGGDLGGLVAEVEHAHGQGADDDGEVQPREEGALVGEVDFGFDAGREGDALAWGTATGVLVKGPGGDCKRM